MAYTLNLSELRTTFHHNLDNLPKKLRDANEIWIECLEPDQKFEAMVKEEGERLLQAYKDLPKGLSTKHCEEVKAECFENHPIYRGTYYLIRPSGITTPNALPLCLEGKFYDAMVLLKLTKKNFANGDK